MEERAANKADRLLQIEQLLLAHPEGLSQADIARRLDVHRSTISRSMDELSHRFAVYEMDDGKLAINRDAYLTQVRFTLHEAMAVHLASRLMATTTDKHNPHAASALRKLAESLRALAPFVSSHVLASAELMDDEAQRHDPVYLGVLETLTRAWSLGRKVRLKHQMADERVFTYTFAPYYIEPYAAGRTAHVIGYREPPNEMRTFKIERIRAIDLLDEPYEIPATFDPREVLADAWGIWYTDAEPVEVVLRFHARVAYRVRETRWHRNECLEPQPDGSLVWRAQVAEAQELLPWVRGWGGDVEVLAPEGLREAVMGDVRRMAETYQVCHVPAAPVYQLLWAKTDQTGRTDRTHALIHHMVDVAQVVAALWDTALPASTRAYFSEKLAAPPDAARRWLQFAAALHDLGKASPVFQALHTPSRQLLERRGLSFPEQQVQRSTPHGLITTWALKGLLSDLLGWDPYLSEQLAHAVGGHHGSYFSPLEVSGVGPSRRGGEEWHGIRAALVQALIELLGVATLPSWPDTLLEDPAFWTLLSGLVSFADWIGSIERIFFHLDAPDLERYAAKSYGQAVEVLEELGWTGFVPPQDALAFGDLFPFSPRPLQSVAVDLAPHLKSPALVIVEAPTGEGKTEAALYLANHWLQAEQQRGTYIAMPTQATSNQMFGRFGEVLKRCYGSGQVEMHLLHGNASLSSETDALRMAAMAQDAPGDESALVAHGWFVANKKRGLLAPFAVGTVDQALLSILQTRHFFVRLFGLSHKTVIFDEVHAYDTYMSTLFQHLLRWLAQLGTNVILLSATLPNSTRACLIEAYTGRKASAEPSYPGVFWATGAGEGVVPFPASTVSARTVEIGWIDRSEDSVVHEVSRSIVDGGCIAVICNTVARAQSLYQALRQQQIVPDEDLILFHARFPFSRRKAIEEAVLARFGKHADGRPRRAVVVATQVIEQSLDLDFDGMISDLAPVDFLLQRAGRLQRHERDGRPQRLTPPRLVLTRPDESDDGIPRWGRDGFVYEPYVLLRSLLALRDRDHIAVPTDVPDLIAEVYDAPDTEVTDRHPHLEAALASSYRHMEDHTGVDTYKARTHLIPWPHDVDGLLAPNRQLDEDNPELHTAWRALTRLAPPSVTLVCLHRQPDGQVTLDRAGTRVVDLDAIPDRETMLALSQETVGVSTYPVVRAFLDQPVPSGWRKSAGLRYYRAAVFENGRCPLADGAALVLDEQVGLLLEQPQ